MEEQSRNSLEKYELKVSGRSGSFDPLRSIPINTQDWFNHIREQIEAEMDADIDQLPDDEVLAIATIDEVSYTDPDTGECDVRYEARYDMTVPSSS